MAESNGVGDRVIGRAQCTHVELQELVGVGCALIVDCEGCERELLDPALVPGLTSSLILVELHDFVEPTTSRQIRDRFAGTHTMELFQSTVRDPAGVASIAALSAADQQEAVDERRPTKPYPMEWLLLTPHGD